MDREYLIALADEQEIILPRKDKRYGQARRICDHLVREGVFYIAWTSKKEVCYRKLEGPKRPK